MPNAQLSSSPVLVAKATSSPPRLGLMNRQVKLVVGLIPCASMMIRVIMHMAVNVNTIMLSMTWLLILALVIPFTKPCWILVGWMILKKCESSISGIGDDADASAISSQDVYDTSPTAPSSKPNSFGVAVLIAVCV